MATSPHHDIALAINRYTLASDDSTLQSGSVEIWSLKDRRLRRTISGYQTVTALEYSPDGISLAIAASSDANHGIAILGEEGGIRALNSTAHSDRIEALAFQNAQTLASAGLDGKCRVWDIPTAQLVRQFEIGDIRGKMEFSNDGKTLVVPTVDNDICVWDVLSNTRRMTIHAAEVPMCIALSNDGKRLATGSASGKIQVAALDNVSPDLTLITSDSCAAIAFSTDGLALSVITGTNTIRTFELGGAHDESIVSWPSQDPLSVVVFSTDDQSLIAGCGSVTDRIERFAPMVVWDRQTGSLVTLKDADRLNLISVLLTTLLLLGWLFLRVIISLRS